MEDFTPNEIAKFQFEALNGTYKRIFGKELNTWEDFFKLPITSKADLPQKPTNPNDSFKTHETSGSTGEPRVIWVPKEAWARKDAIFMRSWRKLGWDNEPILRLISGEPRYSWYDWFRNVTPMNYKTLSQEHVDWVIRNKPFLIHGPGGAIRQLCEMLIAQGRQDVLSSIKIHWCSESSVGHKERLQEFVREFHEQYGLAELPTVGATDGNGRMAIVEEQAIVEILDDKGMAVSEGEEGFIVVTDFNNYQTPVIRYQSGDRGRVITQISSNGKHKRFLVEVIGRGVDYYFGPEVKRPVGWWVVAPISHLLGDTIERWRCEIIPKRRLLRLYVTFKQREDFDELRPYSEWVMENLGLETEYVPVNVDYEYPIYWKNQLLRVIND